MKFEIRNIDQLPLVASRINVRTRPGSKAFKTLSEFFDATDLIFIG